MNTNTIDSNMVARMFLAGAKYLETKKDWINELNVFPVPDGDTGTNMTLTIMAAAQEVSKLSNPSMEQLAKAISSGSLRGARGNSGVILSQLLRGFTKGISQKELLDGPTFAASFERGVETAYKAVMKPKEGTILTVAKAVAVKATEIAEDTTDLAKFFEEILSHGDYVLSQTPEMLPVLKEAGVVDSGGQGLMVVLRGAVDAFLGKEIDYTVDLKNAPAPLPSAELLSDVDIKFGYCTEFIVLQKKEFTLSDEDVLKSYLSSIGDSLVVVSDEEVVKVHVHTNDPGLAIQKGLTYGSLTSMKIDNMREEHQQKVIIDAQKREAAPLKEVGFISVSAGRGMGAIFTELGVDYLIEGGQTMNPSTEDVLTAIERVHAKNIFIFPNNKNIILAANQAGNLTKDKNVVVIPTKTAPQGISAMISYVPEMSVNQNQNEMTEAIKLVKTGQITYAVRDTRIDNMNIHQGDIMGLGDISILATGQEVDEVTKDTVQAMLAYDSEIISLYYGEEITRTSAESLCNELQELYPNLDIELHEGGQPIYYYIVSVE